MKTKILSGAMIVLSILAIFSAVGLVSASPAQGASDMNYAHSFDSTGAVYTMNNAATGNMVMKYDRAANGTLVLSGTFSTQGLGNGTELGSQGSVVLTDNGHWLLAVDAGSRSDIGVQSDPVQP